MSDLECPYCQSGQDVCHDDGEGYQEDCLHEMECSNCEKMFTFDTSIIFYYKAHKADCLNEGEHSFKSTRTFPKECTRMECEACDKQREPTPEEWKDILSDKSEQGAG